MNAGAYGFSISDVMQEIVVYDERRRARRSRPRAGRFHYRGSSIPEGSAVASVTVALRPGRPRGAREGDPRADAAAGEEPARRAQRRLRLQEPRRGLARAGSSTSSASRARVAAARSVSPQARQLRRERRGRHGAQDVLDAPGPGARARARARRGRPGARGEGLEAAGMSGRRGLPVGRRRPMLVDLPLEQRRGAAVPPAQAAAPGCAARAAASSARAGARPPARRGGLDRRRGAWSGPATRRSWPASGSRSRRSRCAAATSSPRARCASCSAPRWARTSSASTSRPRRRRLRASPWVADATRRAAPCPTPCRSRSTSACRWPWPRSTGST